MLQVENQKRNSAILQPVSHYKSVSYDWSPDLPDPRDHPYNAPRRTLVKPPLTVDLRPRSLPMPWQGDSLTSAAHAIRYACRLEAAHLISSRLSGMHNYPVEDEECPFEALLTPAVGREASIRDVLKCAASQLARRQDDPPSAKGKKPSSQRAERSECGPAYLRIAQTLAQLKGCLAEGHGFIFGFSVFESIAAPEVLRSGRIPMPDHKERMLGGLSALAVGYDDASRTFTVMPGTQVPGYRRLPYSYLATPQLASDFWTIRLAAG